MLLLLTSFAFFCAYAQVVFIGKVSEGGRDRVAVAHQHKIGHLVPYLEVQ